MLSKNLKIALENAKNRARMPAFQPKTIEFCRKMGQKLRAFTPKRLLRPLKTGFLTTISSIRGGNPDKISFPKI